MKVTIALLLLLFFPAVAVGGSASACTGGADPSTPVSTPARGSAERKAMLEELRTFVKKMSGLEVIFVVRHLKVACDWSWIETEPQSADGSQHYEPIDALLVRRKGRWEFVESPPEWSQCEPDPDCADRSRYFRKLAARHPGLPAAIFPAAVPDDERAFSR